MLPVSPSQRQVCFSAALTAAAAVIISPAVHLPASSPSASLDAAIVKPSRTSEQPVLAAPEPRGTISRPVIRPKPSATRSAPRVSDDLESARLIPAATPTPSPRPSQAAYTPSPQPARTQTASYPSYTEVPSQSGAYSGTRAFQQCVISRESGGNPQVMNASGHYGLYQFSYSTWVAYGGNPADFGHASVAEQNQVFANAMATPGGEGNWAPYDGC
jgi:Transglycosylase-like domain